MLTHVSSRRRGRSALLLLLIPLMSSLGTSAAVAQAQDADKICEMRCAPRKQEHPFVEIDANTGQVVAGATMFAEGEKVKVIVSGRNPYKYDYQTNIKSSPLEASLFTSFLSLIPGADALASIFNPGMSSLNIGGSPSGSQPGGPQPSATAASACTQEEVKQLKALADLTEGLKNQNEKLRIIAQALDESRQQYREFILATDKDSLGSQSDCVAICIRGSNLLPQFARLTDLQGFEAEVKKLGDSAKNLSDETDKVKAALSKTCAEKVKSELEKAKENAKDATGRATAALTKVEELKKSKPSIDLLGQRIRKTLADNDAFSEERFPYTQGGPATVNIALIRKNLREENAKEKDVGQVDLTVGKSRFSLSAGVGFSTIEDVNIIRDGKKFGEENRSSLRPSLTLMLNAQFGNLWRWHSGVPKTAVCPACPPTPKTMLPVSWGISTGLVVSNRNDTTQTEFILGPTLGLLDNKLFMTFGLHLAQIEKLGGGFKVGQEIPADLTGEPPVKNDWEKGFMLAVTYKLR